MLIIIMFICLLSKEMPMASEGLMMFMIYLQIKQDIMQ